MISKVCFFFPPNNEFHVASVSYSTESFYDLKKIKGNFSLILVEVPKHKVQVPSITSFLYSPEGGAREPCLHHSSPPLQSLCGLAFACLRLNHQEVWGSFGGQGVGVEHNPKYKTKKPRRLLRDSSYSTILFTHSTHSLTHKKHISNTFIHLIRIWVPYFDINVTRLN